MRGGRLLDTNGEKAESEAHGDDAKGALKDEIRSAMLLVRHRPTR